MFANDDREIMLLQCFSYCSTQKRAMISWLAPNDRGLDEDDPLIVGQRQYMVVRKSRQIKEIKSRPHHLKYAISFKTTTSL